MRLRLLYPLVALVVSACTFPTYPEIIDPAPTPVIAPVIPTDVITTENVGELRELLTLTNTGRDPIAALVFTNSAQELMAVHAPSGLLVRWNLVDGQRLSILNVGPVGIGAASFDAEGCWVVTAAGATPEALAAGLASDIRGYFLFDTHDGSLLHESYPYDVPPNVYYYDVALSTDGKWIADAFGGIAVSERSTGRVRLAIAISSDYDSELDRPRFEYTATTFDPTGEWVALIADDGHVMLWGGDERDIEGGMDMHTGIHDTVLALAIDPTRRYIAAVTTENFVMRELRFTFRNLGFSGLIDETIASGPAAGLAFSPDGTLLVASTKADWQLWSTSEYSRLHLEKSGGYAVAFSPDGRFLAIGGTDGIIHIWGVPLP